MERKEISKSVLKRLPGYLAYLRSIPQDASPYISATALAAALGEGREILDLGCGTGLELKFYYEVNPTARVTGIDLSEGMLDALGGKFPDKDLTLIEGSYFDVPLETGKYRAAVSVESLHHFAKEEKIRPELSETEQEDLSVIFQAVLPKENQYYVQADNLGENAAPILITQSEFMRRYREMSAMGGGMNFYGEMPAMYNITVNMQNPLVARIMASKAADVAPAQIIPDAASDASEEVKRTVTEAKETAAASHKADLEAFAADNEILKQITDLALLANGMLKGKDLSDFIARSAKVVEDAYLK